MTPLPEDITSEEWDRDYWMYIPRLTALARFEASKRLFYRQFDKDLLRLSNWLTLHLPSSAEKSKK